MKRNRRTSDDRAPQAGRAGGTRCRHAWLLVAAWTICACLVAPVCAAEPEIASVQVGLAGRYKLGCWTPVEVTLHGGSSASRGQLELTVPDGDGTPSRVVGRRPVSLSPGDSAAQTLFVKFGQTGADLRAALTGDGQTLAEHTFSQGSDSLAEPLPAGQELLVMLGPPIPLAEKGAPAEEGALRRAEVVALGRPDQLPGEWYGYEAVDLLVLSTSRPEIYRSLDETRLAALDRWVRLGGRLLLCVGSQATEILAEGAPLARFAPGRLAEMVPLRNMSALEAYAEAGDRLDLQAGGGAAFRLDVPRLVDVRGRIDVYEGNKPTDLPLVVRSPYGFGEVIFVAFDLDRAPFSNWNGRTQLVSKLLAQPKPKGSAKETGGGDVLGQVTRLGYADLTGQLYSALDQFAGVQLVPFWAVALLVVLYILCIGPGDYFLLKKFLRRMELTWVTFPLVVILFSAGAYLLAARLKGNELRLNQVDLVDVDTEHLLVRGTSWSTIFSPQIESYNLGLAPSPPAIPTANPPEVLLSWMWQPGSLGSAGGGASQFGRPYQFSPHLDAIQGLPIAVWSTRSVVGRWWSDAPSPLTSKLIDRGDHLLTGTLMPGGIELTEAVLLYDRWAWPIRRLAPGSTVTVENQLQAQTAETFLRHITIVDEKTARAPYDRTSTDIHEIVQMLLFHELAGGEGYSGLAHRQQGFIDLSNQVRLGQAVLLGRASQPAATLLEGDKPLSATAGEHYTYYRFVLPVDHTAGP